MDIKKESWMIEVEEAAGTERQAEAVRKHWRALTNWWDTASEDRGHSFGLVCDVCGDDTGLYVSSIGRVLCEKHARPGLHETYSESKSCRLAPSPFDESKWGCPRCGWPLDRRDDMGDGGVTCACGAWVPLPDGDPEPSPDPHADGEPQGPKLTEAMLQEALDEFEGTEEEKADIEKFTRSYMMSDEWVSAWSGRGFVCYIGYDYAGQVKLVIERVCS